MKTTAFKNWLAYMRKNEPEMCSALTDNELYEEYYLKS